MGSVSSVINGNSLSSKHCKASEHRLKEGTSHHRKSGGCSLDELLKCSFTQCSSSSAHPSKGLSHSRSGRSEDFFYIKTSAEKSLVRSTAFKPVNPSRTSSTETGHHNELRNAQKFQTLSPFLSGTLSDSGRNSMSSLPTHSTSGSLSASTGPVSHGDGSSALASSLCKGEQPNFPPWVNGNSNNLDCSYRAGLNTNGSLPKANEDTGSALSADEPPLLPETAGGIRSPITTDESLIERLEQRLLERETELQELQVSFEEKEADTCQLFEERQKYCTEEMEGLKQRCSTKLRQVSQMAAKTHQALQLQVSQLQAEKKKLEEDVSKLTQEKDLVELRLRSYETQNTQLAPTLEETQWEVCQKTGEISLLKQQLRDCQADVGHKLSEIVSLRASLKENSAKMEILEKQNKDHEDKLHSRSIEVEVCQNELQRKKNEADFLREKVGKLEKDIQGMKKDLATAEETEEHTSNGSLQKQVERLKQQLREEKSVQDRLASGFEQERQTWNKEKDRVIKYQKQLQINYLQMHRKNQDLERILKEVTAELESRTELGMDLPYSSGLQTYDDVIATEI
uniref:Leucine zipper, putative tumor suppressor 1 n=1 Tax=Salarias fasciatus TaxID=181472 RepID=A0A672JI26_SALFA